MAARFRSFNRIVRRGVKSATRQEHKKMSATPTRHHRGTWFQTVSGRYGSSYPLWKNSLT